MQSVQELLQTNATLEADFKLQVEFTASSPPSRPSCSLFS